MRRYTHISQIQGKAGLTGGGFQVIKSANNFAHKTGSRKTVVVEIGKVEDEVVAKMMAM